MVKKLSLLFFVFSIMVSFVVPVFAEAIDEGNGVFYFPSAKCRAEVEEGWNAIDDGKGTAIIASPDGQNSLVIVTLPAKGNSTEQLAKTVFEKNNGTDFEKHSHGDGYSFYFNNRKSDANIYHAVDNDGKKIGYIHMIITTGPKGINDPMAHLLVGMGQSIEFVY